MCSFKLQMQQNPFSARAPPRTPLGELTTFPHTVGDLLVGWGRDIPSHGHRHPSSQPSSLAVFAGLPWIWNFPSISTSISTDFFVDIHGNIHGYTHGYIHGLPIAYLWLTCKIATTIPQSTTRGMASYQNDHDADIPFWNCYKNA